VQDQPKQARSRPARILVGDIGATHSRLAICLVEGDRVDLERQEKYRSSEHSGLTGVLERFLAGEKEPVEAACLGLPGPVHQSVAFSLTNLPWKVDREAVQRAIGTDRVALINDVEASAAGIPGLSHDELICLQQGRHDPNGNRVIVSVGTGFGVSALTPTGYTFPTEAGHMTFSPRRDPDFDLYAKLQLEYGHVSWERVASGSALPRIHAILTAGPSPLLDGSEIVRRSETDAACRRTLETFRRYVGAAAGDAALTLHASGGLYLGGGVASNIFKQEHANAFLAAFRDKGRMRPLLERTPVYVFNEDDLALRGAARTAIAEFGSEPE